MNPTDITAGARYHEALADNWSAGYGRGGFQKRMRFMEQRLRASVRPGSQWLDLGCGSGILCDILQTCGARGEGVDGSPRMVEMANQGKAARDGAFTFRIIESIERSGCADAAFDGVLCSSVIEYVDAPDQALDEIGRVVKAEGSLVLTVAHSRSAVRLAQRVLRALFRLVGRDRFSYLSVSRVTYTRAGITAALRARGWQVQEVAQFDPVLPRALLPVLPGSLLAVVAKKAKS